MTVNALKINPEFSVVMLWHIFNSYTSLQSGGEGRGAVLKMNLTQGGRCEQMLSVQQAKELCICLQPISCVLVHFTSF